MSMTRRELRQWAALNCPGCGGASTYYWNDGIPIQTVVTCENPTCGLGFLLTRNRRPAGGVYVDRWYSMALHYNRIAHALRSIAPPGFKPETIPFQFPPY